MVVVSAQNGIEMITTEIDLEIQRITERVLKAPTPPKGTALKYLYSPTVDPTSSDFATEPRFSGEPKTMVDSITHTLHEEMRHNPKMVVFGEDVADCSREEHLNLGEALTSTAISAGLGWAAVLALAMVWSQDRSTRRSD